MKWYYWLLIALAIIGIVLYFWKPWEKKASNSTALNGTSPGATTTVEPGSDPVEEA